MVPLYKVTLWAESGQWCFVNGSFEQPPSGSMQGAAHSKAQHPDLHGGAVPLAPVGWGTGRGDSTEQTRVRNPDRQRPDWFIFYCTVRAMLQIPATPPLQQAAYCTIWLFQSFCQCFPLEFLQTWHKQRPRWKHPAHDQADKTKMEKPLDPITGPQWV